MGEGRSGGGRKDVPPSPSDIFHPRAPRGRCCSKSCYLSRAHSDDGEDPRRDDDYDGDNPWARVLLRLEVGARDL